MDPHFTRVVVTTAICSFPPGAVLFQALGDDGQATRVESITEAASDEIDFVCSLPETFWKRIASFCRSEGFPRTRLTKRSCACYCGSGPVPVGTFFFFLSFALNESQILGSGKGEK